MLNCHLEPGTEQVRVLLIEDSDTDAAVIARLLSRSGLRVTTRRASNRQEVARALEEPFDVVLSDHELPDFTGRDALRMVQESGRDIPFLVVTGTLNEQEAVEYMRAGACDCLLKSELSRLNPAFRRELQEAANRRRATAAEAAHRDSEARYRQIVEAAAEGIFILNDRTELTFVNRRLGKILEARPGELVGRSLLEFVAPQEHDSLALRLRMPQESFDLLMRSATGTPICAMLTTSRVDDEGRILGLLTDITERRNLEQRLIQAEIEKQAFCRELLQAVTRGKLRLVDPEEIPPLREPVRGLALEDPENYPLLRDWVRELASQEGMSAEAGEDLVLAAGEAVTNAIKHAVGGYGQVALGPNRLVVRVTDRGPGMRPDQVPRLLAPGYSTQVSLGMGHTLMLDLADTIWLATGVNGTVVQVEKFIRPEPEGRDVLLLLERDLG